MSRLLLIALDAAEGSLVREWSAAGYLPNFEKLLSSGVMADLGSSANEFPDVVWPVIYSSLGPAEFGRYYYIQLQPDKWSLELVEDVTPSDSFWIEASRHGKQAIVVDAPKTALGPKFNGRQVANWGTHASHSDTATHPPELLDEILARHGRYPLDSCDAHGQRLRDYARLRDQLIEGVKARGRLLTDLLNSSPWDLFFCCFSETHCAGHQFWHLYDPEHPQHVADGRYGLKNALLDVYCAVDQEIGSLIEAAGAEAQVLLFTGHGMRPQYHGRELLPRLLKMWGMRESRNVLPDPTRETTVRVHRSLLRRIRDKIPMPWQYAVKRLLPEPVERYLICRFMGAEKLDPKARAVYVPNNDLNTAIRVNLAGRDKYGRVAPGEEYEQLCDFLTARLEQLVNSATGQAAVEKVTRISERYQGEHRDVLPDLTVLWSGEKPIQALYSPGYGTVIGAHGDLRTGGHAPKGFLVVPQSVASSMELFDAEGMDIGPTVLSLLGVPVPETMRGRSLIRTPVSTAG